ncbi:MAG: aminopeptidase [Thermotogota bacterium]|nr:aminopeptidase [Thermotogota bacterium]
MKKEEVKKLGEKLTLKKKNAWFTLDRDAVFAYSKDYMNFIGKSVTERLAVRHLVDLLRENGFKPLSSFEEGGVKKGDRIYITKGGKALIAAVIGEDLKDGIDMVAAHLDAPRLDLKPSPLVEDSGLAMLKTHYYGGVKKYHWLNIPLAFVGTVVNSNGESVDVSIGMSSDDPVFVISDILPHLDNREGDFRKVFQGKDLNAMSGSIPITDVKDFENPVKLMFLNLLYEKYGLVEEDFFSADIQLVPAIEPREVGLDRSMIGAYAHDDRVCSYTAITALKDMSTINKPKRTAMVLLFDREEIGSEGVTGAKGRFWVAFIEKLLNLSGEKGLYEIDFLLEKSRMISGDVAAGFDPTFKDAHDQANAARLGYGIAILKYTGSRGKSGTSEASAEFMGYVRNLLNEKGVHWQSTILGEVDRGGGGTVAKFFAERGVTVVDAGTAVFGMHSPFELLSKADLYETYRAYKTFLEGGNV